MKYRIISKRLADALSNNSLRQDFGSSYLRNVHEITSTTSLSFCPSSVLWQQLRSLLCACYHALKTNKNPAPVDEVIPCAFLNKIMTILTIIFFTFALSSSPATAHRGAKGEVDTCRISVGDEVVHFSAYTPELSEGESYCHSIPELGLTHLVIDYEGKKLRQTTVEFELTKEPEGVRIYYQKPEKIKKGSIEAKMDFNSFGAGDYLAHITIVNQGETIDSHLPFSVAVEPDNVPYKFIIPIVLVLIVLVMVSIKAKTKYDDSMYSDS